MLFNSYPFVFGFLPVVLAVFAILTTLDWRRATAAFLILSSLFFYGWWNWHYLFLFGFSILFNFSWSLLLVPPEAGKDDPARERRRRFLLGVGIAVNVALLGYFKYRNFLIESTGALIGTNWHPPSLVLPLAVSFFTFEQITFLSSASRGEPGARDFLSYGLFIAFFPHLISGPIVRYEQIYPQLNRNTRFRLTPENLSTGFMIFAIGLFKKVVIADSLRLIVNPLFDKSLTLPFFDAWGAAIAFTVEVYFDFSGYTDMAVGLARIFGVVFPENFDSPYQSRDVIHFWRRWHMTLSYFLRDYVYIPLGGNRHGPRRRNLNLFLTMFVGGLWHGANWTFVVFGLLQGAYVAINHMWADAGRKLPGPLAWPLTFIAIAVSFVFFRASSFSRAWLVLEGMVGMHGFAFNQIQWGIGTHELSLIAIGLFIVLYCPNRQTILSWPWKSDWLWAGAFAALAGLSIMGMANPPPFIYFQF